MNIMLAKLKKALAIALVALQVPMLMLWKITYDAVKIGGAEIQLTEDGGYTMVTNADRLVSAILKYSPVILSLITCLVLSVLGLVLLLRRKGELRSLGIFCYAVPVIACVVLLYAFSRPYIMGIDNINFLPPAELMFFRYTLGINASPLDQDGIYPFLQMVKYIFIVLNMGLSGVLCGLGIAEVVKGKNALTVEMEHMDE